MWSCVNTVHNNDRYINVIERTADDFHEKSWVIEFKEKEIIETFIENNKTKNKNQECENA